MRILKSLAVVVALMFTIGTSPVVAQSTQPAQKVSGVTAADGYEIGPEDVVEVDVLGQSDFRTRVKVKADGTIPLPYLGVLSVQGFNPVTLASQIESKLRAQGIYEKPVVNVEVVSYASRYIIALGEVGSPGLIPVDRAYRLSEILARVGGIRGGGAENVILTREGQPAVTVPFDSLAKGSESADPLVQPGDKIFVPKGDRFYIYGAISSPGEKPLSANLSVRKALARSGGVSPTGSEKRVKIFHDGVETKKVDLERIVQPEDVIVVGERLF